MNQDGNEPRASSPPPLPRVHSPLRPPSEKKGSLTWLWILLGVMGILLIGSIVGLGVVAYKKFQEGIATAMAGLQIGNNFEVSLVGLMADRAGHVTAWQESSFEAAGEPDSPPEGVFDLISYPAPAGDLAAYLTPAPKDGQRRPAVVWAKGGFGGIGSYFWEEASPSDDQSARAFREAGLVLMCPSWRGENANPGRFESFYGEVNDLLAAIDYVKTLPYVDPERVYLGGHSTGGTMVLLAATAGAEVRATFSFGGAPGSGRRIRASSIPIDLGTPSI